ncbi:MAG: Rieske 2Fe-2S domain-containing protein [Acidimicrobiales bacterium]
MSDLPPVSELGTRAEPPATQDPHLLPPTRHTRRAEMLVAGCFIISFLSTVALTATYSVGGQIQLEGGFLGMALGSLGAGLAAWGKYLMPAGPFVEARHYEGRPDLPSTSADRAAFAGAFGRGAVVVGRRGFLLKLLGGAGAAILAAFIFPLRSLGPQPKKTLFHTRWKKGTRMVKADGTPIHVRDIEVGGFLPVFPEGGQADPQVQANDQVNLLHVADSPIGTKQGPPSWSPYGYLAFSRVCTHAGCPVTLYEKQVQQLLCPCHQSLFTILDGCFPIFGPAPRPLPQLAIYADSQGYLRSRHGFLEAIGPGFWERSGLPKGGYRS